MSEKEVIKLLGQPVKDDRRDNWSWIRYDKFYPYILQIRFEKDQIQLITIMDPVKGFFM